MAARTPLSTLLLVLVCVGIAHGAPTITNKKQRISAQPRAEGHYTVFVLAEDGQVDLDGNGTLHDHVLHLHHRPSQTTQNLGWQASPDVVCAIRDGVIAFAMPEATLQDLNGDGDQSDLVLQVHDIASGTRTNTGLAVSPGRALRTAGGVVLALRDESVHGDMNGDGDVLDTVPFVRSPAQGARSLGHAIPLVVGSVYLQYDAQRVVMVARESENVDWNGDGDTDDTRLVLHDVAAGTTTRTALDGAMVAGVDTDLVDRDGLRARARHAALRIHEGGSGQDLNGDGDMADAVLHLLDMATGTTQNLGYATTFEARTDGTHLAFQASEVGQGADLNGDGDMVDSVMMVHDLANGLTSFAALGFHPRWQGGTDVVGSVSELGSGQDLDGDGQLQGSSAAHYEIATGQVTVLPARQLLDRWVVRGRNYYTLVRESLEGQDLNGDGDQLDWVAHHLDLDTLVLENLGLASSQFSFEVHARGSRIAFTCSESANGGTDRTGDGDASDETIVVHDVSTGTTFDTAQAGSTWFALAAARLYHAVSEPGEGQDLDLDGDALDDVLFVVRW